MSHTHPVYEVPASAFSITAIGSQGTHGLLRISMPSVAVEAHAPIEKIAKIDDSKPITITRIDAGVGAIFGARRRYKVTQGPHAVILIAGGPNRIPEMDQVANKSY